MTNVSNNYQADYASALKTAVIGGGAWGVGQYFFNKRPFVDSKGNMKDTFIKEMESKLVSIKDNHTLENIKAQKLLEKEIDAIKTHDELKQFVNNRKNEFMRISEEEVKILNEELSKSELNESKNVAKHLFKCDGKYQKYYKDTLDSCYEGKTLKHNASKISKEKFGAIKEVIQKTRRDSALKSAGTFMLICGALCCFFEFWDSRKK